MAKDKSKKNKYIFLFLRIAVIVGGIAWAINWVSKENLWGKWAEIFTKMNPWIFAGALGVFLIGQFLVGLRWWLLLRSQSIFIKFFAAVRLHFLGLFYNNFMPSSVGGDLIRAWYVTKHTDKKFEAALSVFVDRVIGLLSTFVIAAFFYLMLMRNHDGKMNFNVNNDLFKSAIQYKGIAIWAIVIVAVVFCGLLLHQQGRKLLRKIWSSVSLVAINIFSKLRNAVVIYCSKPVTIFSVFGLTVFIQIMVITSFWFLGRNLGIEASIKYYFVFFTLTWVLGAIPISIGGAVVVEFLLAALFIQFAGVDKDMATALALCQRAVWMLSSLPGAVIHLFGAHLPKDFSVD